MREDARTEAKKQWNSKACGELDGEKDSVEYFLRVEQDRYQQQRWVHEYFGYDKYGGKKVLEIGIGQGTDLMQFANAGADCYGVDITSNHLELTQKNFELRGKKVKLHKADATSLPFPEDHLDCVYSFGVLHHIPEMEKVLEEIYRVLKPGGVAMVALYYKWSAFHIFWKLLAHGLRHGWLFTKGYKGLLSTIEEGADGINIKPYVKLYSKHEVVDLFSKFDIEDVSVHQLEPGHFWPSFIEKIVEKRVPMLEPYLGWYVTCKVKKPLLD